VNIFVLDTDPVIAAQMHCDKHVVKMVLEMGQMLSTVHRRYGNEDPVLYKPTHQRHPCTLWIGESVGNYDWAQQHFSALAFEYSHRYGKRHKTYEKLWVPFLETPADMPNIGLTPFAQAMPDEYKHEDAVIAYRRYYLGEKSTFLNYTKRGKPTWLTENYSTVSETPDERTRYRTSQSLSTLANSPSVS
jgi:hypothetical protein